MSKASQLCCFSARNTFPLFWWTFFVVQTWEEKLLLDGVVANCTHNSSLECGLSAKTRRKRRNVLNKFCIILQFFIGKYKTAWATFVHLFPGRFESSVAAKVDFYNIARFTSFALFDLQPKSLESNFPSHRWHVFRWNCQPQPAITENSSHFYKI